MASIIRIKRSSGTAKPGSLNWGEMAYVTGIGSYGGTNQYKDRVFLGDDGTNVNPIAGHYYTSMMEHTPGALAGVTNSRNSDGGIVAVVDSNRKIDIWNVDNITLNGNEISSTDTDGDLVLNPNGSGDIIAPDDTKFGFGGGASGTASIDAFIRYDEAGQDKLEVGGARARFSNSTQATTTTDGAVSFDGGIGVVKNAVVGGDLIVSGGNSKLGNIRIENNIIASLAGAGNKIYIDPYPDGLSNEGTVIIKGDLQVDGTQTTVNSTSVTSNETIFKLGDVTSSRTVTTTVGTGVSAIVLDSLTGINTGDTLTHASLPGAGRTTVHSYNTGSKTVYIDGTTTAGIATAVQITITHAYDTNTDRGISYNYNTGIGTANTKLGFFGYDDSTGKWTFIPDATDTNSTITGTKGYLDIKGIYYQSGDFSTSGVVYFDNTGLQKSTVAPASGISTSNYVLTTTAAGTPTWTDTLDGGTF